MSLCIQTFSGRLINCRDKYGVPVAIWLAAVLIISKEQVAAAFQCDCACLLEQWYDYSCCLSWSTNNALGAVDSADDTPSLLTECQGLMPVIIVWMFASDQLHKRACHFWGRSHWLPITKKFGRHVCQVGCSTNEKNHSACQESDYNYQFHSPSLQFLSCVKSIRR